MFLTSYNKNTILIILNIYLQISKIPDIIKDDKKKFWYKAENIMRIKYYNFHGRASSLI